MRGHGGSGVSHSAVSKSLRLHRLWSARLLCPWDSLGKNTGMNCHALLQRIFLTHGSNPGLWHCRQIHYRLSYSEVLSEGSSVATISTWGRERGWWVLKCGQGCLLGTLLGPGSKHIILRPFTLCPNSRFLESGHWPPGAECRGWFRPRGDGGGQGGVASSCLPTAALSSLPEYGPVGLLLLFPVDDAGEEPKGLRTCRRGGQAGRGWSEPECLD